MGRRRRDLTLSGSIQYFSCFKGVSRQRNALNGTGRMQLRPIDIYTRNPNLAESLKRAAKIGDFFAWMRKRLKCLRRCSALLTSQRRECIAGSGLNENPVRLAKELGQAVGEANCLANVARPIGWIGGFFSLDPGPADIGEIRDARRL